MGKSAHVGRNSGRNVDVDLEKNVTQTQTQSDDEEEEEDFSPIKNMRKRMTEEYESSDSEGESGDSSDEDDDVERRKKNKRNRVTISPNVGVPVATPGPVGTPRMDKDRHEFEPSGFRSPASAGHILQAYRSLLTRYEETKATAAQLRRQVDACNNEIKRLQRREIIGTVRRKCALRDLPDEIKLHVRSMKEVMKHVIVRNLKFQERGWDNYSEVEGTVCAKVMGSLDLPLEYTKENKMGLWCNILAPQMTKTLGTCKNKITQAMREQFNCKFCYCTVLSMIKS